MLWQVAHAAKCKCVAKVEEGVGEAIATRDVEVARSHARNHTHSLVLPQKRKKKSDKSFEGEDKRK